MNPGPVERRREPTLPLTCAVCGGKVVGGTMSFGPIYAHIWEPPQPPWLRWTTVCENKHTHLAEPVPWEPGPPRPRKVKA